MKGVGWPRGPGQGQMSLPRNWLRITPVTACRNAIVAAFQKNQLSHLLPLRQVRVEFWSQSGAEAGHILQLFLKTASMPDSTRRVHDSGAGESCQAGYGPRLGTCCLHSSHYPVILSLHTRVTVTPTEQIPTASQEGAAQKRYPWIIAFPSTGPSTAGFYYI